MICNVSKLDRVVRGLLAIVLIGAAVYFIPSPMPKTLVLTAAVLLLASAWFGVCYIYKIAGISTARPTAAGPQSEGSRPKAERPLPVWALWRYSAPRQAPRMPGCLHRSPGQRGLGGWEFAR